MIKALPRRALSYFKEARDEMQKVAWPTQRTTLIYSAFVVAACVILAVYFGVLDWALTQAVDALLTLRQG